MGRRSKATQARRDNLRKLDNPQNPSVEDVSDDEDEVFEDEDLLEHGFFFLDDGTQSEEDSDARSDSEDEGVDGDELDGHINEAEIEHFNAILFEAQAMAVKAEREAIGEKPKRKRHYTGNSNRTLRYHAQKRRQLAATNQKFISSWFSKGKKPSPTPALQQDGAPEIIEISEDSDPSDGEGEGEDEIDASLHRLFPRTSPVSLSKLKTEKGGSSMFNRHLLPSLLHSLGQKIKEDRQLHNKLSRSSFDSSEMVSVLTMTAPKLPQTKFSMD